jgi:transposase InsO family protein
MCQKNARYALVKEYHDGQAHIGLDKTILSISSHFWFPKMRQFVTKYIDSCLTCLTRKRKPKTLSCDVHSIPKAAIPFNTIHVDCFGPLPKTEDGFTHVFVAVDAYSKYCFLYALKSLKTDAIADCVQDIIFLVGTPARIITDNGVSLRAVPNHTLLTEWNIEWHFITPYVHQANGQAERYMSFIANLLRVQAEVTTEWSTLVSRIQLIINSTVHKSTKRTPLQTLFGCDNRLPEIQRIITNASDDKLPQPILQQEKWRQFVNQRLIANSIHQEAYANRNSKPQKSFTVGDFVLLAREALKPKKFESGWTGPYKITAVLSPNRYELRRVGDVADSTRVTSAAACQMRLWAKEWCPDDCADLLESYSTATEDTSQVISLLYYFP